MRSSKKIGGFKKGILQCRSLIKVNEFHFNPVSSVASESARLLRGISL